MPDRVDSPIDNRREERHVQFKRTMNWSESATKSKVVKTAIRPLLGWRAANLIFPQLCVRSSRSYP